jgi:hypothetical protein
VHIPRFPFFHKQDDDLDQVGMGDEATAPPVPETGGHHDVRHNQDEDLPNRFRQVADEVPE